MASGLTIPATIFQVSLKNIISYSTVINLTKRFIIFEFFSREGEPRIVVIEKGIYPLGISIGEGTKGGGVFVTLVNDNSVAGAAGLQYGDQLLEVISLNLFE